MPQNTRSPLTVFTGQQGQIRMVSKSHGVVRPNLVESVDFTPKLTVKQVDEWDNPEPALLYQTFDGGSGKIGYDVSNQGQIEAAMMDQDPTVATFLVDPAQFQPMTIFANLKGQDSLIKRSFLMKNCIISGNPATGPVKDSSKSTIDFMFLNVFRFMGLAILYTRATSGTALVAVPAAPAITTQAVGGSLVANTYYVRITAVTAAGETAGSIEVGIHVPVGTITNQISVPIPALAGSITAYNIYVSNVANGEKLVGTDAVGGDTFLIKSLPSPVATSCPNINTTGVFAATGDQVFSGQAITFNKPAFFLPQTGLGYVMVIKNGSIIAAVNSPATEDTFLITADGTQFTLQGAPAATDVYDIFTLYQP